MFEDPRDGTVIGPAKYSGYIDMMHVPMQYNKLMDDREFPLAALLREIGDTAYYTYDLGDHWEHRIVLEDILAEEDSVTLVAGMGACPPEDNNGLPEKGCRSYAEFLDAYKKNPKKLKMKEIVREVNKTAMNYSKPWMGPPITFKPLEFNITYHRNLLNCMLAGPSVKSKGHIAGDEGFRESMKGCEFCGNRLKVLMKCVACQKVSYCSKDCQVKDWKTHKAECKKQQKSKSNKKR